MKNKNERVAEEFDQNLGSIKKARITSLTDMVELETMTRTLLQHEAIRIEQKFGADHPRTESLNARLITNLEVINTLNVEREVYAVEVPEVAEDSALIHGRVVDDNRRGVRGLTVSLVTDQSIPVRGAVESVTAETGYFAITVNAETLKIMRKMYPNGVYLAAHTGKGELLYRERKPLVLVEGARILLEIPFDRRTCIKEEEPGKPSTKPPGEDEPVTDTEDVKVPKVVGIKLGSAKRKIKKSGFAIGKISYRASQVVGVVLAQEPKEGTLAPQGSTIDLVVGKKIEAD